MSAVVCCFPKRELMCAPPSTSLNILHWLVSCLHRLYRQSIISILNWPGLKLHLLALLQRLFISLLCLCICKQMHIPIYILDMFVETCVLGEILSLPRFVVAFLLEPDQYLNWEWYKRLAKRLFSLHERVYGAILQIDKMFQFWVLTNCIFYFHLPTSKLVCSALDFRYLGQGLAAPNAELLYPQIQVNKT